MAGEEAPGFGEVQGGGEFSNQGGGEEADGFDLEAALVPGRDGKALELLPWVKQGIRLPSSAVSREELSSVRRGLVSSIKEGHGWGWSAP